MSGKIDISFLDDDDIAQSASTLALACPNCGEAEVVAAMDAIFFEEDPKKCQIQVDGPWFVVPLMCADEGCGAIFGMIFGQLGMQTVIGYAIPEFEGGEELFEYDEPF